MLNLLCKIVNCLFYSLPGNFPVLYHLKALFLQPGKLTGVGILKIHPIGFHQRKSKKLNVSSRRHRTVQLTHGTAAEISRILVFRIHILDFFVDLLKITVGNHRLAPEDQLTLIGDLKRNVGKYPGVGSDDLAHLAVSSGNSLAEFSILVGEYDSQTVQLPGHQRFVLTHEGF